jgi:hypothetical protein
LKEVAAEWSLPVPPMPPGAKAPPPALRGEIKDGKLTVVKEAPLQGAYVEAKMGKLTSRVRVRVAPPIPYKYDFTKPPEGAVPAGWINAAGKFAITKMPDGTIALRKLANNSAPPLARANAFINLPTLTDYTIQADLLGTTVGGNLPDMGIVANRYTLALDGNKQQLKIVSWESTPRPRVEKVMDWKWQANTWYRMKFTVEVQKEKAIVHGKVWPRDKDEPKDWTIEYVDELPNREGAPALYGYATGILDKTPGAEIFYNNVSVTPNGK